MLKSLPLRSIYIPDNTNVVHFERSQQVKESCRFELYFTEEEMQSVFPSLQVEVRNQEEAVVKENENVFCSVSLEGGEQLQQNINKAAECFQDASIETIIEFYVGSQARLQINSQEVTCTIIGLQKVENSSIVENKVLTVVEKILNVINDAGEVKRINLKEVEGIKSLDEGMSNAFLRSLSLVNFQRKNSWKVTIFAEVPNNDSFYNLYCNYSLAIKTSHSERSIIHKILVNKLKTECKLQTMILVTNNSTEDWSEVTLKRSRSESGSGLRQINILQGQSALLPYGNELTLPIEPLIKQGKLYLIVHNETECRILSGLASLYVGDQLIPVTPPQFKLEPAGEFQFELDVPSLCKINETRKETTSQSSTQGILDLATKRLERKLEKEIERNFELINHSDQDYKFECFVPISSGQKNKSHTADSCSGGKYYCLVTKDSSKSFKVVDTVPCSEYDTFKQLDSEAFESLAANLKLTSKQSEILQAIVSIGAQISATETEINSLSVKVRCELDIVQHASNSAAYAEARRTLAHLQNEYESLVNKKNVLLHSAAKLAASFPKEVEFTTIKPSEFVQSSARYEKLFSAQQAVSFLPSTQSTFSQQQAVPQSNNAGSCLFGTKAVSKPPSNNANTNTNSFGSPSPSPASFSFSVEQQQLTPVSTTSTTSNSIFTKKKEVNSVNTNSAAALFGSSTTTANPFGGASYTTPQFAPPTSPVYTAPSSFGYSQPNPAFSFGAGNNNSSTFGSPTALVSTNNAFGSTNNAFGAQQQQQQR